MISTKATYLLQQENKTNNGMELSCATLILELNKIQLKSIRLNQSRFNSINLIKFD